MKTAIIVLVAAVALAAAVEVLVTEEELKSAFDQFELASNVTSMQVEIGTRRILLDVSRVNFLSGWETKLHMEVRLVARYDLLTPIILDVSSNGTGTAYGRTDLWSYRIIRAVEQFYNPGEVFLKSFTLGNDEIRLEFDSLPSELGTD
ncbi:hypothetical protein GF402_11185 [Candidatus Fermentibacteria bacterium]|nr:hypothetical protein [Candidatus Fermentibacteria bacterium]